MRVVSQSRNFSFDFDRTVFSSIIPLCSIVSKDIKILHSPCRHKMDGVSTEWRLTQALARETTAKNFIRGDKTTP